MKRLLLAFLALLALAQPAAAHRLKLFATVEDGAITGYAFFVGGGRPQQAVVVIRDGTGSEVFRGATDDEGRYRWAPPTPDSFTVAVDTRDGHVAEVHIGAERFAGSVPPAPASMGPAGTVPAPAPDTRAPDARAIELAVDRAVERQIRPLLEAYDAAEGRLRFNDIVGGIGMIVGLAGIALWAASRRRKDGP